MTIIRLLRVVLSNEYGLKTPIKRTSRRRWSCHGLDEGFPSSDWLAIVTQELLESVLNSPLGLNKVPSISQ